MKASEARKNAEQYNADKATQEQDRGSVILKVILSQINEASKKGLAYFKLNSDKITCTDDDRMIEIFTYSVMNSPCFLTEIGRFLKETLESEDFGYNVEVFPDCWSFIVKW